MILSAAQKHEHRGVIFYVGPRTPCPGIGWAIPLVDRYGAPDGYRESCGAFYDDCADHPEGAYAWAEAACRQFIDETWRPLRDPLADRLGRENLAILGIGY